MTQQARCVPDRPKIVRTRPEFRSRARNSCGQHCALSVQLSTPRALLLPSERPKLGLQQPAYRESKMLSRAVCAAIGLIVTAGLGTPAVSQDQLEPAEQLDPADGLVVDEIERQMDPDSRAALGQSAEFYADDFDITVEEATRRLLLQAELEDALAELEEVLHDRFVGAWIEHEPEYRGVRLTGNGGDVEGARPATAVGPSTWPRTSSGHRSPSIELSSSPSVQSGGRLAGSRDSGF